MDKKNCSKYYSRKNKTVFGSLIVVPVYQYVFLNNAVRTCVLNIYY